MKKITSSIFLFFILIVNLIAQDKHPYTISETETYTINSKINQGVETNLVIFEDETHVSVIPAMISR